MAKGIGKQLVFAVKMLDGNGEYMDDITSAALKGASTVGMAILPSGDFLTLNWRTKEVTKCNHAGEPLQVGIVPVEVF